MMPTIIIADGEILKNIGSRAIGEAHFVLVWTDEGKLSPYKWKWGIDPIPNEMGLEEFVGLLRRDEGNDKR